MNYIKKLNDVTTKILMNYIKKLNDVTGPYHWEEKIEEQTEYISLRLNYNEN